jgi:hypothetical protein
MRTFAIVAVILGLLSATAYSQQEEQKPTSLRSEAQKKEDVEIEKTYREMINRTKGQVKSAPAKTDPWQSVRPSPGDTAKR